MKKFGKGLLIALGVLLGLPVLIIVLIALFGLGALTIAAPGAVLGIIIFCLVISIPGIIIGIIASKK